MNRSDSHDCVASPQIGCPNCGSFFCGPCGVCRGCGRNIRNDSPILRMIGQNDSFYEGAYSATVRAASEDPLSISSRVKLPFVNYGYVEAVLKLVPRDARVLEIGSGGGVAAFGARYSCTALDLSYGSLERVPASYACRVQGSVSGVDFAPGSFDAVVSSFFWEHLLPVTKDEVLEKVKRWLVPGGRLVMIYDTESQSPVFRALRRRALEYRRAFVEHDGHFGLESVRASMERIQGAGFAPIFGIGLNRTIQHLPVYVWLGSYSPVARPLARVAELIQRSRIASLGSIVAIHAWDLSVGRLFPESWSRLYLGAWEKS